MGDNLEEIYSYPKVFNLGHPNISELLNGIVLVEEKIDGSQISFMFNGKELHARSKGKIIVLGAEDKMFTKAIDAILDTHDKHGLRDNWIYRGEYLEKPKHNTMVYNRIPKHHIVIYDIERKNQDFLPTDLKLEECNRLDLECVPSFYQNDGKHLTEEDLKSCLNSISMLGNTKIEGLVIKNYARFGEDKKVLMGKYVCEEFKELNRKNWKENNPGQNDIISKLGGEHKTEARWNKAIQHLKEQGVLKDSPTDIACLMKEIGHDIDTEQSSYIKEQLYKWAWPKIQRIVLSGFPQWYKEQLLKKQFEENK